MSSYSRRTMLLGIIMSATAMAAGTARLSAADGDLLDGAYAGRLAELARVLREHGHDIAPFLENPSFTLHEDIDAKFLNSAEKTGAEANRAAAETGDEEHQARVFEDEFARYKSRVGFVEKQRGILPFIAEHSARLDACEATYDIPAEVIAAVIGVESNYGAVTGRYFAFNVYVSMYARDYRSSFALTQLEELLTFAENREIDIFTVKSSYAGAMGYMQFIPASLNRWFVGDDLYDMNDNIASVANYLAYFKKERGSVERAVYSYNPSELYTRTVLELADYAKAHRGS